MKPTLKTGSTFLLLLTLLLSQSGCTYALWTDGTLDAYREPAPTPNLRLYESQKQSDILVVYGEYSDRYDSTHTRAYWLNQNESRIENDHAPAFARKLTMDHLSPVPIFYSLPEKPDLKGNLYAVCYTNQNAFVLYSGNHKIGSFNLPVYKDRWGTVEKVALTPMAVTADVSVVSAVAAVYMAYGMAQSGQSFQVGK